MSTAIRPVRIMAGAPRRLSGAPVRLRIVRRLGPWLVQSAVAAGVVVAAAADAGEV